ncbi:MAG TPA: DNA methyltransferase [Gemmatimonadaceae bacterium]|nr:DNA methyltransferase [Gemmatimonadaceae bacterium]
MLALRSAAQLLAAARDVDSLAAIAGAAGFSAAPLPLDTDACTALGVREVACELRVIAGAGTLRALLIECPARSSLRDSVAVVTSRLAARAPHLLWLVVAARRESAELAIVAWSADSAAPRVSALVIDRDHVLATDALALASLAATSDAADVLTHASWLEVLGREALTRRFYRTLEAVVAEIAESARGEAPARDRHELALLHVSRLLFLSFLETKGWLDGDRRFLANGFARCMERGGNYHRRVLRPLLFGTLNTPVASRAPAARAFGDIPFLNGGLFAPAPLERRWPRLQLSDASLGRAFGELFARYRFTAREDTVAWSEAAIDPEMLGKAFESLMCSQERRTSGAFYTPQSLVSDVTRSALASALARPPISRDAIERAIAGEDVVAELAPLLRERVADMRVLDPACGSGAFLVHALESLAALRQRAGDTRPLAMLRRELLTRSIFGVDVNATAVWLCELRLWLSVVIESDETDGMRVPPLPNLDRHIRVGDSLSGDAFEERRGAGGSTIARMRQRYARATGTRKRTLERALQRNERAFALAHVAEQIQRCAARRRDLLAAMRGRDLFGDRVRPTSHDTACLAMQRTRARELMAHRRALRSGGALPFAWATHFPDVAQRGGFDLVIGNPPWVRLHRIPAGARAALRARFTVFGDAAWERGARTANAGTGFAAQVDLGALFLERSLALTREHGSLALLLPAKMWRSLAGGGARRLLRANAHVIALDDWSESPAAFDAAVYPSLVIARKSSSTDAPPMLASIHRKLDVLRWTIAPSRLALDGDLASPWIAIPPAVRESFDRVSRAGTSIGDTPLGAPLLGVKCGCNEAFVVECAARVLTCGAAAVVVRSGERSAEIEREILRPLLRGEGTVPWRPPASTEAIIWTHDESGAPRTALPVLAAKWLARWRRRLVARSDARAGKAWWTLFRTPSASSSQARVVWADMGRAPRALLLPAGDRTVPLNSCYVVPCAEHDDALALMALLNSPLAAAWLHVLAEPARGGYHRYLGWTVALLPLPRDWRFARELLVPLAQRALDGHLPSSCELVDAATRAYGLRATDVAPLIAWSAR